MKTATIREQIREDLAEAFKGHVANLSPLRDAKVLVTGGTGFVGTWLAEAIGYLNDDEGFGTSLVLQSPHAGQLRERHPHLGNRADVHLVELDIRHLHELPESADYIVHAAASPDGRRHASDPTRTMETILVGTTALMKAALRSSELRKVLNISSGLVYGPQPMDLDQIPESYIGEVDPSRFTSAYAEAKRAAETICASYAAQYRLPIVTARPFAFVGPYQLLDRPWAVNNFVRDATLGENVRIHSDGLSVRSYMYPADMAAWLLVMLVNGEEGAAYNIGHPNGITLLALAEKIVELAKRPVQIETGVLREARASRSRFVPDVSKANRQLKLSVHFDLDKALQRMMAWAGSSLSRTN